MRVAWFAPNAGNWVTFRLEHRVCNAMADLGHDVTMIQCDSVLDEYCQVMLPAGLLPDSPRSAKRAVCRDCQFNANLGRATSRYATAWLSSYLDDRDRAWVDEALTEVDQGNWSDVHWDGLPIGRYAAYTTLLHYKERSVTDSAASWTEYLADLRGCLLTLRAMPRIAESIDPTHAATYNALYPANRVFCEWLVARGAVLLNVGGGPTVPRRYASASVYDDFTSSQTMTRSPSFAESWTVPVSDIEVAHVADHIAHLMSAADPWVYSAAASRRPAADIRGQLGLALDRPVVVVLIGSLDESRAVEVVGAELTPPGGYSDVLEFLRMAVVTAREAPELDFVFRLHPRMAPNRREGLASPDLATVVELLADLPTNAVLNRPEDGLSLYDVLQIADAGMNHTSTSGLEFLAFGVPLAHYDPARAHFYPAAMADVAAREDSAGLTAATRAAAARGFSLDSAIRAYRVLAALQMRSVVHLDPLLPLPDRSVAVAAPVPVQPRRIGALMPGSVKEPLARWLARRARRADLDGSRLAEDSLVELDQRIPRQAPDSDVWVPLMVPRGTADEASERRHVADAMRWLAARLDLSHPDGLGAVRGIAQLPD
jgi:hypothetical protein